MGDKVNERKRELGIAPAELPRDVLDTLVEGVQVISPEYRYLYVNDAVVRHGRTSAGHLLGKTMMEAYPGIEDTEMFSHLRRCLEERIPYNMENEFEFPDGSKGWFELRIQPVAAGAVILSLDITQRKRGEAERLKLEQRILMAQKMESLGVLAGGIAHDFNNLLMAVLGNAGLALMKLQHEAPAREHIELIEKAAVRAAELTNQLLAYSGRGRFVVEPIDLSALVHEMGHLLETIVSTKAALKYDLADHLPKITVDVTQIRQVVMNLLTNASDAVSERSGVITITSGVFEADRPYLVEAFGDEDLEEGLYVYVEVSDTGCGMDERTRGMLFDPFFSTKQEGRGLGLAAVLGIVRGHNGAIKVYSEKRRGTTIKVMFPVSEQTRPVPLVRPKAAINWRGTGTVLVVDDEEAVRDTTKRILEAAGFDVVLAADGHEAVEVFHALGEGVCLVVMDMTMPRMGGAEAFTELRRIRRDVPVILSSGYNEQDATNWFAGKGLAGFIQKPYSPQRLIDLIRGILES